MTDKIVITIARIVARAIALVVTRIALTLAAIVIIPIQLVADIVMIVIRLAKTPTAEIKPSNIWWTSPSSVLISNCAEKLTDDIF